ncbi:hypothetical protein DRP04_09350 [Archaeoglobales archaeon]|nr:MAG: hypothetical protein DRP04_09350 [Archaeoglobales archaeon]
MKIRTPSRIHITLVDLNGSSGRIDGGVGLALDDPYVLIKARESDAVEIKGDPINLERFKLSAHRMYEKFKNGIEIDVQSDYRPHVGLGSGTQISLAVGKAYNDIYDLNLGIREIAKLMGRGGTSGIGVAAFEVGGFIVDGGHSKKEKTDFLPSSASKAKPGPIISRLEFPEWDVVLATPDLTGFFGRREVNLFQNYCPIPLQDVRKLCHVILMNLLPGVAEVDLDEVSKAIGEIQRIGFKRIEIEQYGDLIKGCLELSECCGMSSTGPTVYAFTDTNSKGIAREFKGYFRDRGFECETLVTKARNRGAKIEN